MDDQAEYSDVLIIGAGISGLGAAYRIHQRNPAAQLHHPRAARAHRRHVGPVPLPGHPLRQRHLHPEPAVRAVDQAGERGRRWRHPRLPHRRRPPPRHRPTTSGSTPTSRPRSGTRPPTPGRCARRRPTARTKLYRGRFVFFGTGYYDYDKPYSPGVPRHRGLRRRRGAPAVLAGVAGPLGQAGRRDRQRRDGHQPGARAGEDGRPRHDAAALADLHDVDGADRPDGAGDPKGIAAQAGSQRGAGPQRRLLGAVVLPVPQGAEVRPVADQEPNHRGPARGLRRRPALQAALRPVGPADVPGARPTICSTTSAMAAPRW